MTEKEAIQDLAIRHYPGKWKTAQGLAHDDRHYPELDYWARARKLYLELGGEFVGQLPFLKRLLYLLPLDLAHKA